MPKKQLQERYVVFIRVKDGIGSRDWFGEEYETYPTADQIADCLEKHMDKGTTRILYARVEKHYRLV